ncbi:hypothetical protein ACFWMH_10570 [Streptomyces tendae]|uniref:hypothetical protein n=1 Tax=Streptomyces tendae TaxID=1932 RepID=UPI00365617BA
MRIEIIAVPSVSDGKGLRYRTGQVVDVDDDQARAWVAAGHARRTSGKQADKRTATRQAPNTAKSKATPKPTSKPSAPAKSEDEGEGQGGAEETGGPSDSSE